MLFNASAFRSKGLRLVSELDQRVRHLTTQFFCNISANSYSLRNKYFAPTTNSLSDSPSMRASCCDGSAANGIPRRLALCECLIIASGSSGPIKKRSRPPTRSAITSISSSRASGHSAREKGCDLIEFFISCNDKCRGVQIF